ncbi:hypothetical protein CsatB_010328 [Cannabis sativa]
MQQYCALIDEGIHHFATNHSLFIKHFNGGFLFLLVYVDDVIITNNNLQELEAVKVGLNARFKLKDLGQLKYFLGLEVARSEKGIFVSQRPYVAAATRAWIQTPRFTHLLAAQKVLEYVKSNLGQGLYFAANTNVKLPAYTNSDWAAYPDIRRYTTRSSVEAEYRTIANTACEIFWLLSILRELNVEHEGPNYFVDYITTLFGKQATSKCSKGLSGCENCLECLTGQSIL